MFVDGFSSLVGSGVGLILVSPKGGVIKYSLCFEFPITNKEAKYKALTTRLKMAKELGIRCLKVYSDSQLVAKQVRDKYEAWEENMKYL